MERIKQYKFVMQQIGYKEQRKKSSETNLGFVWNLLNPLLYMVILSTYYTNIITHDIDRFPVFVFTGITIFNYYNSSTKSAMKSLVSNKNLLIKTKLPIEVFVVNSIYSGFREFVFSSIALVPICIYYKVHITWRIIFVIPILLITSSIITSMGKILAICYTFFGDIEYLYSVLMSMLVFVSGTFLPLGNYPENIRNLLTYNPIFLSIILYRNSLMYGIPSHWTAWAKFLIWFLVLLIFSRLIFDKKKDKCINML